MFRFRSIRRAVQALPDSLADGLYRQQLVEAERRRWRYERKIFCDPHRREHMWESREMERVCCGELWGG
ncbi:MAG TPA: hypothetical protein VJC16_06715 [Candidatus Nanoarchaeia archaeon]|nr:hypothetical protein [Candidatus Nanoarchaeia archaeon]